MIEIYLLEQLVAFARCGTLSAASEELHLTQPSLSRSMQKLESILGVALFERQKNKLLLNDNGRLTAEYAERILKQEKELIDSIRAFDRSNRTIMVGACGPGPILEYAPILSSLYSDLTITSEIRQSEELIKGIKNNTYQLIILNYPLDEEGIYCQKCGTEQLYLSVLPAHPASGYKGIYFKDLNGESFLMASQVGFWNEVVRRNMPNSRFLLQNSSDSLGEVARSSFLPTFDSDIGIRVNGNRPNRVSIPFFDPEAIATYYLICLTSEHKRYNLLFQAINQRLEK